MYEYRTKILRITILRILRNSYFKHFTEGPLMNASQAFTRLASITTMIATMIAITSGCTTAPPANAPVFSEPPAVIADNNYVSHVAVRTVEWDVASFRRWLEKEQMITFLPKDQGIPGAKSATPMRGTWGQNGSVRRVNLENGHYVFDHITNTQFPELFQYQVYGFTNEAGKVAEYIKAEFRYTEAKPGFTTLQWTYSMRPKSMFTRPFVNSFMNDKMKPYMEAGMDNMATAAKKAAGK
jgi:Polyketide cyclase / dehydrase and lipid transport